MMQHNPHFRVLALTATPGGKPEVVQEIVDALHISHIEIRSESDPDLKKYLHTKHEQEHFVHMTEDIAVLRDALAAMMTVSIYPSLVLLTCSYLLFVAHHPEGAEGRFSEDEVQVVLFAATVRKGLHTESHQQCQYMRIHQQS